MLSADVTFEIRLAEAIDEEFTDTKGQLDLRGHAWPWPHIPYLPHSHTRGSFSSPGERPLQIQAPSHTSSLLACGGFYNRVSFNLVKEGASSLWQSPPSSPVLGPWVPGCPLVLWGAFNTALQLHTSPQQQGAANCQLSEGQFLLPRKGGMSESPHFSSPFTVSTHIFFQDKYLFYNRSRN